MPRQREIGVASRGELADEGKPCAIGGFLTGRGSEDVVAVAPDFAAGDRPEGDIYRDPPAEAQKKRVLSEPSK